MLIMWQFIMRVYLRRIGKEGRTVPWLIFKSFWRSITSGFASALERIFRTSQATRLSTQSF